MNMCFGEAVVEVLFCCKLRLASWRVHPLKLTKKHILLSKYVLIVISDDFTMIRSQNAGYHYSVTKCKKCVVSVI